MVSKQKNAKIWIKALGEDVPGEWYMEQDDMDLIREALQVWLNGQSGHMPTVLVDGVEYIPRVKNVESA